MNKKQRDKLGRSWPYKGKAFSKRLNSHKEMELCQCKFDSDIIGSFEIFQHMFSCNRQVFLRVQSVYRNDFYDKCLCVRMCVCWWPSVADGISLAIG